MSFKNFHRKISGRVSHITYPKSDYKDLERYEPDKEYPIGTIVLWKFNQDYFIPMEIVSDNKVRDLVDHPLYREQFHIESNLTIFKTPVSRNLLNLQTIYILSRPSRPTSSEPRNT